MALTVPAFLRDLGALDVLMLVGLLICCGFAADALASWVVADWPERTEARAEPRGRWRNRLRAVVVALVAVLVGCAAYAYVAPRVGPGPAGMLAIGVMLLVGYIGWATKPSRRPPPIGRSQR